MKPVRSLKLKFWLPLLITGGFVILWVMITWNNFHGYAAYHYQSSLKLVTQAMTSLQQEMSREIRLNNPDGVEQILTQVVDPNYHVLLAMDGQGGIQYATDVALHGRPALAALSDFDRQRLAVLQSVGRTDIRLEPAHRRITAYLPLPLAHQPEATQPMQISALFAIYDLRAGQAEVRDKILQDNLPIGGGLLIVLLALIAFQHYFVTRPIAHLVARTRSLAKGEPGAFSRIQGSGELAQLSAAFNKMSVQLEEQSVQRNRAEKVLQESEERWQFALEGSGDGVWDWNAVTNKVFFSISLKSMLGFEAHEISDNLYEWDNKIHPDDKTQAYADLAKHIAGETAYYQSEHRLKCKDGSYKWILNRGKVIAWTQAHKPRRIIGTYTDITERKQTERALRRSQKMEAIGQLTGGIAHDFNNILNIILGNIELLEMQMQLDEKSRKRLETVKKTTIRAAELTKQLLGFSRRQVIETQTIDLNQLIAGMENLIARALTPEITVQHQFADALWLINIDSGDFEDALLNLAINARDAMAGHGALILETANKTLDAAYCAQNPEAKPGDYVILAVSDSGEGIAPDIQEKIFEPFFSTKETGKGTGLGLSMVFGFVKRSAGYVKVYSELGVGTTFRIFLPRVQQPGQTPQIHHEQQKILHGGHETLLVVDDEGGLVELAEAALTALGYRVLTANNGPQALAVLSENRDVALLFSDVVMPGGMNGYELAEKASLDSPHLKVQLTSGYTEKAVAHNGYAHFSANLLTKPYTQFELAQRVRLLLDVTVQR